MKGDKIFTNDELIAGVLVKDTRIIKFIMNDCYPAIEQMVLSNSGNKMDAEEVFQEALIVLFLRIRQGNFELTSSINTYLYSIAKNKWLQDLRRKRPHENLSVAMEMEVDLEDDTINLINRNERLKLYRKKFDELSKDCKRVLQLFLMKVPLSEITKIMDYSSEQVARNRRYKCKEKLISIIQKTSKYKELSYENIQRS